MLDDVWFSVEPAVGDVNSPVAGGLKCRIAGSISLEGGSMAVKFPAIELGDHPRFVPERVDEEAEGWGVEGGLGQVSGSTEIRKEVLERRASFLSGAGLPQQASHRLQRATSATTLTHLFHSGEVEQFPAVRLLPSRGEAPISDDFHKVEECASDRCDRDSRLKGSVLRVEPSTVYPDLGTAKDSLATRRGGDVHRVASWCLKTPEGGCTAVAQQCIGSIREGGRQPSSALADVSVPDRKDVAMHGPQLPAIELPLDSTPAETKLFQLPERHDPVLLFGQLRHASLLDHPRPCLSFPTHTGV